MRRIVDYFYTAPEMPLYHYTGIGTPVGSSVRAVLVFAVLLSGIAPAVNAGDFPGTRNDPSYRENAPPAYFPNTNIPPKYPAAKPQTHGLDLSKHDWETAKAYFKWLCENEAGEFIYKTVENVESVFEMRRRPDFARDWRLFDRYYLEDPWGWPITADGREQLELSEYSYVMPSELGGVSYKDPGQWQQKGDYFRYYPELSYPVLERISAPLDRQRYGDAPFIRYTRVWPTHPEYDRDEKGNIRMFQLREYLNGPSLERRKQLSLDILAYSSPDRKRFDEKMLSSGHIIPKVESVHEIKSRYGFMWRGIERSQYDRELGIGGGEVLVFDLRTKEVLAVRRNFRLAGPIKGSRNVFWLIGKQCLAFDTPLFHKKVLKPIDPYKNLNIE